MGVVVFSCGQQDARIAVNNFAFSLTMFPLRSNQHVSHLDLRRLPETSRGRGRERLPRAVSQPALGRPLGTTTRMMSERPQWSAARRVPRSQGARGRLANVLRRVSHTRQSVAYRTAARAPFRRSAPSLEGDEERGAARCAKGSKSDPPGSAQRWLFDKVKHVLRRRVGKFACRGADGGNGARANLPTTCGRDHAPLPTLHALNFTPVARMERSAIREQPIHALNDGKGRSRISLRFIRATGRASSKQRAPAVASRRLGKSACRGADGAQSGLANLPTIVCDPARWANAR